MSPSRPLPDLPRVFLGGDALSDGLLTRAQLRGPLLRRVLRGVYTHVATPHSHGLLCEAAGLLMPPTAALTGRSAATVSGVPLAGPDDEVEVLVPERHAVALVRGVAVRRVVRMPGPTKVWRGTTLAPVHRIGFDLAARYPLPLGVAHLDRAVAGSLLRVDHFTRWLDDQHCPDVQAVRDAAALVDPRSESIPESVMRVHLVRDGLPVVPQYEIRHAGRFVARVDLALSALKIAIEYDGSWHVMREQLERDRDRLNRLQAAGWLVVHVTAQMLQRPDRVILAVRDAMATRASFAVRGLAAP